MTVFNGDCLDLMKQIPDGSVDMVLCDLPYGTTACKWDSVIPFEPLWREYRRVCRGAVVLTAAQPFTSAVVMSATADFWHSWTWIKPRATGFQNAKKQPLRATEDVLVFRRSVYNPQGVVRVDKVCTNSKSAGGESVRTDVALSSGRGRLRTPGAPYVQEFTNYPRNILEFGLDEKEKVHPTQKPVALMEYLIRTYTNEGETVLDNCMGSGTTGVACINTGRKFIGIEKDEKYFQTARDRIAFQEYLRAMGDV